MFYAEFYHVCSDSNFPQNFDFYLDCNSDRYAVEQIKCTFNRVTDLKIFKWKDPRFELVQKFSARHFCGSFFAHVRLADFNQDGFSDIVANVYNACCCQTGTAVLINACRPCVSDISDKDPCAHLFRPVPFPPINMY